MVCLCPALCFCRLLSSCRCCRPSRQLRPLINARRHAGTATASCRAIISHRITAFQLTPRKIQFRAWRVATGALGISIQPQVITGTMATGTISAGLAFTVVATMAAASALAGRGRRSGRSGIAAEQAIAEGPRARASVCRQRPLMADTVAKVESCISLNFGETLKREAIDDSSNLSRITEVAYEFSVWR